MLSGEAFVGTLLEKPVEVSISDRRHNDPKQFRLSIGAVYRDDVCMSKSLYDCDLFLYCFSDVCCLIRSNAYRLPSKDSSTRNMADSFNISEAAVA